MTQSVSDLGDLLYVLHNRAVGTFVKGVGSIYAPLNSVTKWMKRRGSRPHSMKLGSLLRNFILLLLIIIVKTLTLIDVASLR
jgi:hypothetical protein